MKRDVIGNTAKHLQEQMGRTLAFTTNLQQDRPGTSQRTTQEKNRIWNQLISLPREERQAMMVAMAERAGHVDGEQTPCEVCNFVGSKAMENQS